jgi:hypothetical protein
VSKSDPPPPQFIMPGDDPKLDELLEKLREDSEDGDPFYLNYRKLQQKKLQEDKHAGSAAADRRGGAAVDRQSGKDEALGSPAAVAEAVAPAPAPRTPDALMMERRDLPRDPRSTGEAGSSTAPVAAPDAVEVDSVHSHDVPVRAPSRSPRVLWFLALAIVAPAITLALGALWMGLKDPGVALRAVPSNEPASAAVSAAPTMAGVPVPAAPTTAATDAATAATVVPTPLPVAPVAPTSEPDAGAARVPAAPPNGRLRSQPKPTTSSAPHAGSGDNDDPGLN